MRVLTYVVLSVLTVSVTLVTFFAGVCFGQMADDQRLKLARKQLVESCSLEQATAATVHEIDTDIEVCISGSHRMQ